MEDLSGRIPVGLSIWSPRGPCWGQRGDSKLTAHCAERARAAAVRPGSHKWPQPGSGRQKERIAPVPRQPPPGRGAAQGPSARCASNVQTFLVVTTGGREVLASSGRGHLHHPGSYQGCLAMNHRFTISALQSTYHALQPAVGGRGRTLNGSGICPWIQLPPRERHQTFYSPSQQRTIWPQIVPRLRNCTRMRSITDS